MNSSWAAVFDWDGVILDSSRHHEESWERLARETGKHLPVDHFRKGFGRRNIEIMRDMLGWSQDLEEIDRLSRRKEELYREVVQLRGELAQLPDGGCTTFAIGPAGTASGTTLVGQTSDNPPELEEFGYVLKLRPTGKPAVLMWTFGGMLGYHGLNEHGVSQFANALGGGPGWRFALSHYPLKRLMLEQTSLAGVRDLVRRLPVCSNGNYMLADGSGSILDLELTSAGVHELPVEGPCLVHSNHFLCAAHACQENWNHSPLDSAPRLLRMKSLLESRLGSLDVAQVGECLADHAGYPVSICRHPSDGPAGPMLDQRGKTVAALIAEPQSRRLHVARGNPCVNRFVTYQLD